MRAFVGDSSYEKINPSDRIRLGARDAGWRMFLERPVAGRGPNSYIHLKPNYLESFGSNDGVLGAFNSWLIVLVEFGIVGAATILLFFTLPLLYAWRSIKRERNLTTMLALSLTLGVLGITIHLFFIDLLYSFAWAQVGLALGTARLASESLPTSAQHA